jgi:hypothetical protein
MEIADRNEIAEEILKEYIIDADCFICIYDITNINSVRELIDLVKYYEGFIPPDNKKQCWYFVGNKSDDKNRECTNRPENLFSYVPYGNIGFIEISAKENKNKSIDTMFRSAIMRIKELRKNSNEDKNKEKDKFLYQLKMRILFRKIKALLALRKFKEAYDIFYNKSENNPNNDIMNEFMELKQVKELLAIVKNGYENTLGHYDYIKMLKEEENNFDFTNYGEYINPKIEIKSEKGRGIKLVAKEKINIGELLIAEKALAFSRGDCDSDNKEDIIVSKDNPKVIVEIELFNKLFLKLKKSPLDYEKFYLLYDGRNLEQDISERKKYLEEQDKGMRDIELFKINQAICLNKYGSGRYILMDRDIGAGLWGYASFFNHDCLPNTNHFGIGDFYFGYCIREIDKGEELTTKYVSSRRSYKERQQIILENWRFNCNCQLCKYQLKKNDTIYENYMEMMNKHSNEIPIKNAKLFEEYL